MLKAIECNSSEKLITIYNNSDEVITLQCYSEISEYWYNKIINNNTDQHAIKNALLEYQHGLEAKLNKIKSAMA